MDKKEKDKKKKKEIKISSLDIDKREYQEIVLSNSNHPDKPHHWRGE